jgi:protein TonB
MNVYAPTPGFADRRPHPRALVLIVAGHAALIAAVMAAKMDLPQRILDGPLVVRLIPLDPPPPAEPQQQTQAAAQPSPSRPQVEVPVLLPNPTNLDTAPNLTPIPLPSFPSLPTAEPGQSGTPVLPEPVRTGPRFATPASQVRPPYPESRRQLAEEAVLKLRLSIDERGRITAVESLGNADPAFLQSARRHIIAHWRYKPAMEGERPVASSTVITLRFELDD